MTDSITEARKALEAADEALARALEEGATGDVLERAEDQQADAADAYYRACDQWGRQQ